MKPCSRPCEVYSRVVGYFRPVQQWNKGKQAEFEQRVPFNLTAPRGSTPRDYPPPDNSPRPDVGEGPAVRGQGESHE